jgi:hypothetical protein
MFESSGTHKVIPCPRSEHGRLKGPRRARTVHGLGRDPAARLTSVTLQAGPACVHPSCATGAGNVLAEARQSTGTVTGAHHGVEAATRPVLLSPAGNGPTPSRRDFLPRLHLPGGRFRMSDQALPASFVVGVAVLAYGLGVLSLVLLRPWTKRQAPPRKGGGTWALLVPVGERASGLRVRLAGLPACGRGGRAGGPFRCEVERCLRPRCAGTRPGSLSLSRTPQSGPGLGALPEQPVKRDTESAGGVRRPGD